MVHWRVPAQGNPRGKATSWPSCPETPATYPHLFPETAPPLPPPSLPLLCSKMEHRNPWSEVSSKKQRTQAKIYDCQVFVWNPGPQTCETHLLLLIYPSQVLHKHNFSLFLTFFSGGSKARDLMRRKFKRNTVGK